jgi:cysteine desulfurase
MTRFYLDHNATTPLDPRVREAMEPYLHGCLGNPSSLHAEGRIARAAVDNARDAVAAWLGAKPSEIIFTGGGTESNNLAVLGLALAHQARGKHVITCATEHHAVLNAAEALRDRHGFDVTFLPVDALGQIDPAQLKASLRPDTTLVSVMAANNETGTRQPLADIGALCAERGILFHTDAVQAAGKETLDLPKWQVSALSVTAHKFYGPVGAGVLYLRVGIPVQRLLHGGAHENERRPGTENVAAIVGLATAARLAEETRETESVRQFALVESLWSGLQDLPGIQRNGHPADRISNTLNLSFAGLDGEELLMGLDLEGLAVSSGSACLVGSVQVSHVLQAMGVPAETARATVRLSVGKNTKTEDSPEIIARLRKVVLRQSALR